MHIIQTSGDECPVAKLGLQLAAIDATYRMIDENPSEWCRLPAEERERLSALQSELEHFQKSVSSRAIELTPSSLDGVMVTALLLFLETDEFSSAENQSAERAMLANRRRLSIALVEGLIAVGANSPIELGLGSYWLANVRAEVQRCAQAAA